MRELDSANEAVKLELSLEELRPISNALNEVCNALDVREFDTRMGTTIGQARELLRQMSAVLDRVAGSNDVDG